MDRRQFLKMGSLLPLSNGVGFSQTALAMTPTIEPSTFPETIMSGGFSPQDGQLTLISGHLPSDITGHVFLAEGIPLERNHLTPNGRGALTRFDFGRDGVRYKRRMINTPSAIMQASLPSSIDQFRLAGGTAYMSSSLGFVNYCNTAPNYMGDNRFAMSYEGGIPFEFDAQTLEMVTPIGDPNEWRSSLPPFIDFFTADRWLFPQIRTTGHPFFDLETGECITLNYGGNIGTSGLHDAFMDVVMWDGRGKLTRRSIRRRDGKPAFIAATSHSLSVTRHHVLIFETAARVENSRFLGGRRVMPQSHRTPVWIIRKADLQTSNSDVVADYIELDFDTSDIMCNYDDHMGEITLYGQYMGAMDKSEQLLYLDQILFGGRVSEVLSGWPAAPVDVGGLVRARIQVTASGAREITEDFSVIRDENITWDMNDPAYRGHFQFPESFDHIYWAAIGYRPEHVIRRVANAYENYPNRFYRNDLLPTNTIPSTLLRMDCQQMRIADSYTFPDDCIMRTPQFMARPGSVKQDDGYVFTAVVRKFASGVGSKGKEIWIFDGKNLAAGPVAILADTALDFATTNHALWVEKIGPRPQDAYRAQLADYFTQKLGRHTQRVQTVLKNDIIPIFS